MRTAADGLFFCCFFGEKEGTTFGACIREGGGGIKLLIVLKHPVKFCFIYSVMLMLLYGWIFFFFFLES